MKKEIKNYLSSLKSTLDNINIEEIENVAKLFISTRDSNKQPPSKIETSKSNSGSTTFSVAHKQR